MFSCELDRRALGRVRFFISPLWTAARALRGTGRQRTARRLPLLTELMYGAGGARGGGGLPPFFTPWPEGYESSLDDELHRVATTPPERIRAELARTRSPLVRGTLERGEDLLARTAARELAAFWDGALRTRWPELRARLDADIGHRARQASRDGLDEMLGTLHPAVGLAGGLLTVAAGRPRRLGPVDGLLLMPVRGSDGPVVAVGTADPSPPALLYPVAAATAAGRSGQGPVHRLMGDTRTLLLADLTTARSTAELAGRHGLTPSTVSYHLGVLLRSGLVTRHREARRVLYVCTHRAAPVLELARRD
ncbi:helix-turn-helix domain-containing protein [Streptomyces sp. NPDC051940]|uniref:helix-turn-helix domain-containing protein n=1 Tax=Streptomyces sp. NPDC051940 TaxID=3155675 RepID=UPI003417AC46